MGRMLGATKPGALVSVTAFWLGCTDSVVELAVIQNIRVEIQVPATATGPFEVSVYTWGGCVVAESTEVEYLDSDMAVVEPYDRRRTNCDDDKLCAARHQAQLTFDTVGEKVVIFRGRDTSGELIEVPRMVLVE